MASKTFRHLALAIGVGLASLAASAQMTQSPYSRFGYGLLRDNATAAQSQMGGVGYAMSHPRQINVMNPASYAMTDSMNFIFDMGLDYTSLWSNDGETKSHGDGGGLDYITMQFPVWSNVGMSVGLLPYSSVGYSFGSEIANGSSSYQGIGGINLLYLGAAWQPLRGLSLGFNFAYMFGTTYNDVYARTDQSSTSLFEQIMQVRDFHAEIGVLYRYDINSDNSLSLGVTYSPGKTMLGHTWVQKYDVGTDAAPDTVAGSYTSLKGRFSLPTSIGAGIAWQWRKSLLVEADFTWQNWAKAKLDIAQDFTATEFANRYRGALGVSWQPAFRGGYLRRITYRLGGHFTRDYVVVDGNHVRDWGISCGFGFPTYNQKTVINLGFEYLRRQCHPTTLLAEDYLCIRLGLNFNQTWFMKNKLR